MLRTIYIILGGVFILLLIATVWRYGVNQNPSSNLVDPEPIFFPSGTDVSSTNPEEIKQEFNAFLQASSSVDVSTNFSGNGQLVSLTDFYEAVDAQVNPRVSSLLDQYEWRIYRCADTIKQTEYPPVVVAMRYKFQPDYPGDLYQDQNDGLKSWETTLLQDTQSIIFPSSFGSGEAEQTSRFELNTTYAYVNMQEAKVLLDDGAVNYLRYIKIGDELLVGSQLECLLRVQEQVFDTGA